MRPPLTPAPVAAALRPVWTPDWLASMSRSPATVEVMLPPSCAADGAGGDAGAFADGRAVRARDETDPPRPAAPPPGCVLAPMPVKLVFAGAVELDVAGDDRGDVAGVAGAVGGGGDERAVADAQLGRGERRCRRRRRRSRRSVDGEDRWSRRRRASTGADATSIVTLPPSPAARAWAKIWPPAVSSSAASRDADVAAAAGAFGGRAEVAAVGDAERLASSSIAPAGPAPAVRVAMPWCGCVVAAVDVDVAPATTRTPPPVPSPDASRDDGGRAGPMFERARRRSMSTATARRRTAAVPAVSATMTTWLSRCTADSEPPRIVTRPRRCRRRRRRARRRGSRRRRASAGVDARTTGPRGDGVSIASPAARRRG